MLDDLAQIQSDALADIEAASDEAALEQSRVAFLGKKGRLTAAGAGIKEVPKDQKAAVGQKLNEVRQSITTALEEKLAALNTAADAREVEGIDLTLPGRTTFRGNTHPLSQITDLLVHTLRRMGFALASGPEIETEFHCFDALNTPADHPARNEKDTFFFNTGHLLRTHTSTVQIRAMESVDTLPLRVIAPGSAFRRDEIDATHLNQFTQIEGLYVDEIVTLGDLKGTLEFLLQSIFGEETPVRFRPHFFPFTEPSFEVDVQLRIEGKDPKWIEIAGCGMVDPNVFSSICEQRKDDLFHPDKVTGYAFGMGVERLAMILWSIPDIRLLIENDARFLTQFG
ncbi:MAG: phenylalanine--tRNA ligase subunit alpha [Verrucomicrobiota bacterium]